jgi:nitrite reductase/ring-hydroxylating ferredoxin subunit
MDEPAHAWRAVTALADLPSDQPFEVAVGNTAVILVRWKDEITAFQGICPHAAARLGRGRITDGWLHCPQHKASFKLSDGTCGKGWRLPALRRYAAKLEDGMIYLSEPLREIDADG